MPDDKTNQLKLYVEQETTDYDTDDQDSIRRLCSAFESATGYGLTFHTNLTPSAAEPQNGRLAIPLPDGCRSTAPTLELAAEPTQPIEECGDFDSYVRFAEAISAVLSKLHQTRSALRNREGELAAGVPLVCDPTEDSHHIAARLEAVLEAGTKAVNCCAGALLVLDDFTQHLKLRAHWGLSDDRFADPPFTLRDAKADLEALVGHAVVLDKASAFSAWNAPYEFNSAVCVPVSTATVPLGTMWFFDNRPRQYEDHEVGIIEVIAGRLAAELEREILLRSRIDGHAGDQTLASEWSRIAWPAGPDLDGWQFSAGATSDEALPSASWRYKTERDSVHFSMSSTNERGLRGALLNAGLLGSITPNEIALPPVELARYLDATVAQIAFDDFPLSSWCATLESRTGHIDYCQTGAVEAFVIRPHAWELLSGSKPKLATDERVYELRHAKLEPGDALLVIAGAKASHSTKEQTNSTPLIDGPHLAEAALRYAHQTTEESLRLLRSLLNRHPHVWQERPSVMLTYRE